MSDDASDTGSEEECLKDMLGGISFEMEWQEEDDDDSNDDNVKHNKPLPGLVTPSALAKNGRPTSIPSSSSSKIFPLQLGTSSSLNKATLFQRVTASKANDGAARRPDVQVVDMGENRGNGLVATRPIGKGEVIFTERAFCAAQLNRTTVSACLACFRSLEGISKLLVSSSSSSSSSAQNDNRNDGNANNDNESPPPPPPPISLPCPERWPVLPLEFEKDDDEVDKYGRVQCRDCKALFCCQACATTFERDYGSCCSMTALNDKTLHDNNPSQGSILSLAIRAFVHVTRYHRTTTNTTTATTTSTSYTLLDDHPIFGLCGEPKDVHALELGSLLVDDAINSNKNDTPAPSSSSSYSLASVYQVLVDILVLNKQEQKVLSLDLLHSLASKAARNGFCLQTQSPFKLYYAGMLRHNYGNRDSATHKARMSQIAMALKTTSSLSSSSSSSSLLLNTPQCDDSSLSLSCFKKNDRDMDRRIEALVAPEIAATFLLTAMCNHSCNPNAEVKSQEFVDAHIDLVAIRDIPAGQEVSISYIGVGPGVGKKSTAQRRRELRARYLFDCDCSECCSNSSSSNRR